MASSGARRGAAALLLALGGCGGAEPAMVASTSAAPTLDRLTVTPTDTEGIIDWLRQQHGKPVLSNYWATWCAPCLAELPDLLAGTREFRRSGGVVVGIAMERMVEDLDVATALAKARAKAEELHLDFPVLVCTDDDMNRIRKVLGVELGGFPQTLTYDRTGKLVAQHEGIADAGEFAALASDAER